MRGISSFRLKRAKATRSAYRRAQLLDYLCEEHILNLTGGRYYWMAEEFPAADLSLRSVTSENFLIIDITRPEHRVVIGEMDRYTVPMLLHEHAIYMHEGQQYQVEKLDFTEKKAYVRSVDVDYYTDADLNASVKVLDVLKEQPLGNGSLAFGDVLVTWHGDHVQEIQAGHAGDARLRPGRSARAGNADQRLLVGAGRKRYVRAFAWMICRAACSALPMRSGRSFRCT